MESSKSETNLAVIAAPNGVMASSLRTFLQTIPGDWVVASVNTLADACLEVDRGRPKFLLLDAELAKAALVDWIEQLLASAPGLRLIVLVNSEEQQAAAQVGGAAFTLLKGFLENDLRQLVE